MELSLVFVSLRNSFEKWCSRSSRSNMYTKHVHQTCTLNMYNSDQTCTGLSVKHVRQTCTRISKWLNFPLKLCKFVWKHVQLRPNMYTKHVQQTCTSNMYTKFENMYIKHVHNLHQTCTPNMYIIEQTCTQIRHGFRIYSIYRTISVFSGNSGNASGFCVWRHFLDFYRVWVISPSKKGSV